MMVGTIKPSEDLAEYFQNLSVTQPVTETELKIALKELSIASHEGESEVIIHSLNSTLEKQLIELGTRAEVTEQEFGNLLQFFKILSEDPGCKGALLSCPPSTLLLFGQSLFPKLTALIGNSAEGTSLASSQRSSALLHKTVRISLNLVKSLTSDDANMEQLREFGLKFIELLSKHPVAMLDIKCNAGLVISHLVSREFVAQLLTHIINPQVELEQLSGFESAVWDFVSADYVNKVAFCFGALGTRHEFDPGFMESVAKVVLLQTQSNSTKEAVNLGSARVLEIWMDKIVRVFPESNLPKLADVFPHVEIFIFTYMAGHIDAVKNCCRNMLSNLSVVYSRLEATDSLLRDLLVKILAKPYHIKWVSLAAVTRSNPKSVIMMDLWTDVANKLLCAERTFKNAASEVYLSLMKYTPLNDSWASAWIHPLFQTQESQNNESNWSQKKVILTKAFKEKPVQQLILSTILSAINSANALSTESWLLVVECLKIAVELGIELKDALLNDSSEQKFRGILPREIFESWTYHANPQIRLASFSLLVDTKKTSEVFAREDLEALKLLFRYNLVNQNPAFRQQFFSYFKKLMRRLKDGHSYCKRMRRTEDLTNYDAFISWMWAFFTKEGLFAGANFSRRCQSLTCLTELMSHFSVDKFRSEIKDGDGLDFLRWLGDSYENNKVAAVEILSQIQIPLFQDPTFVNENLQRAMTLLVSVKPPESVTGRYLLLLLLKGSKLIYPWNILRMLLAQLEQINYTIKKKVKNLLEVSSTTPPYGIIRAIRLIFDTYKTEIIHEVTTDSKNSTRPLKSGSYALKFDMLQEYSTRLLTVCFEINEVLFPVLGDAAPEGFLPDLNENDKVEPENSKIVRSINAQMLLVASWRSMKDICILLTELCVNFPLEGELANDDKGGKGKYILKFDQVKSIGDHLLYLLMNLMHRGVFEQVFVGFKSLAVRLKKSPADKLSNLSQEWLEDIMAKVVDKCTTRRSAGLPFIFQAILTPEAGNEQVMTHWMTKLIEPEAELRQFMPVRIHSMNVLRALFRDATFSHAIMEWVPEGIQLAFRGLRATEWAEQNSGLMLYGSVIRRTFGPKLNLMSAPTFFRKFPQMYDILLEEIRGTAALLVKGEDCHSKDSDFAYHLLLLFSCFSTAPGKLEEGNFLLSAFIPHVRACGNSRDIQVRTIAAKALVPFITSAVERRRVLEQILDDLIFYSRRLRNNKTHGDLLQLIAILNRIQYHEEKIHETSIEKLQEIIDIPRNTKCPLIFEAMANLSVALRRCGQTNLEITAMSMQRINQEAFETTYPAAVRRNSVVGLPDADTAVYTSAVIFCDTSLKELLLRGSRAAMDSLLTVLLHGTEMLIVDKAALVQRYSKEPFEYAGQTELEFKYLDYFGGPQFEFPSEMDEEVMREVAERMLQICEGEFGTVECKGAALKVLAKIVVRSRIIKDHQLLGALTDLLVEWTGSTIDDELRSAVAEALPKFPLDPQAYTTLQFCKFWAAAITLAQDDEISIRSEVHRRFNSNSSEVPACSPKCLEIIVSIFFSQITKTHTVEGLWTILALLMRDDYEVLATGADDEEEDRLFERSEMNMFAETVTLTNVVNSFLENNQDMLSCCRDSLKTLPSGDTLKFFNEISRLSFNFNVTEGSTGADLLGQVVRGVMKEVAVSLDLNELLRGHEKSVTQNYIRQQVRGLFLLN